MNIRNVPIHSLKHLRTIFIFNNLMKKFYKHNPKLLNLQNKIKKKIYLQKKKK